MRTNFALFMFATILLACDTSQTQADASVDSSSAADVVAPPGDSATVVDSSVVVDSGVEAAASSDAAAVDSSVDAKK